MLYRKYYLYRAQPFLQAAKESEKEGFVLNELEYIYAVARIRALESSLLTQSVIEQLMACQNETQSPSAFEREGMGRSGRMHTIR